MKKVIFALALSISVQGMAQEQDSSWTKLMKHEVGIDATALLGKVVSFGFGTSGLSSPYSLIYRYRFNEKWNLRERIGGSFSKRNGLSDNATEDERTDGMVYVGSGFEFNKSLGKRWSLYTGAELNFEWRMSDLYYQDFGSQQYDYISEFEAYTYGVSPVLGFRFKIAPAVSLTAESSLLAYYEMGKSSYQQIYDDPWIPDVNTSANINTFGVNVAAPIYIYLNFSF